MSDNYLPSMKRIIEGAFDDLHLDLTHKKCVLLDYPVHGNVGDHLIWLGEFKFLRKYLLADIRFCSYLENGPIDILKRTIGKEDIIFLHGGGNWGDLWPKHQIYRQEVISHFKDHQIIVFPQTLYFQNEQSLVQSAGWINQHSRLTVMVRDKVSESLARQYYTRAKIILCPDMAFYLDINYKRAVNVSKKQLMIVRKDKELKATSEDKLDSRQFDVIDWSDLFGKFDLFIMRVISYMARKGTVVFGKCSAPKSILIALLNTTTVLYRLKARLLIKRAVGKFRQYESVITTRMHGYILATLMRINSVLLPNSYYKNQAYHECWAEGNEYSQFQGK